jgi:predicted amidohydrolase YtcJ
MSPARATIVVTGDVVVAADARGLERAEAVGIAGDRIVAAGSRESVLDGAAPGARVVDAGPRAVIPGLHDFHIHLVGLARTRDAVPLDDARDGGELLDRIRAAAGRGSPETWITGRGWSAAQMAGVTASDLDAAAGERLAFLTSHDGHSAWASPAARRLAGLTRDSEDPPGGRIERASDGTPSGVLRERAMEHVSGRVPRLQGDALRPALDATLRQLAAFGLTGASEAGDYTDENGIGADAALGDSYSTLTDLGDVLDGRLRMTLGIPVVAIPAAGDRGHRTGMPLDGRRTMRFGWAKEYSDGALGSGTAALFTPRTCGEGGTGILRVTAEELDRLFAAGRQAGIGLAVHAIGDRAAAAVLDAMERAAPRRPGAPNDRMEHAQLLRRDDFDRFAAFGVVASIQPIHAAADRDLVEACWDGRQDGAYAWRSLLDAGARLVAGSDAPVEDVNPWEGIFAAVHRRLTSDARDDWRPQEALTVLEAVHAYTRAPAEAIGAVDEGHLRVGARADLAVLNVDLDTILAADQRLASVRSDVTFVAGAEVPLG